jgi:transcriptional regulator with XRE-family HTH domain
MPAKKSAAAQALGEAIRAARRERGEFNITLSTLLKIAAGLGIPASSLVRRAGH